MAPNEEVCKNCGGSGMRPTPDPSAPSKEFDWDCPVCDGFGVVEIDPLTGEVVD